MIPHPEPPSFRLIVRGIFQFPDGRRLTRAVTHRVMGDPKDEERVATAYQELLEELQAVGYPFREGHGMLFGTSRVYLDQVVVFTVKCHMESEHG